MDVIGPETVFTASEAHWSATTLTLLAPAIAQKIIDAHLAYAQEHAPDYPGIWLGPIAVTSVLEAKGREDIERRLTISIENQRKLATLYAATKPAAASADQEPSIIPVRLTTNEKYKLLSCAESAHRQAEERLCIPEIVEIEEQHAAASLADLLRQSGQVSAVSAGIFKDAHSAYNRNEQKKRQQEAEHHSRVLPAIITTLRASLEA